MRTKKKEIIMGLVVLAILIYLFSFGFKLPFSISGDSESVIYPYSYIYYDSTSFTPNGNYKIGIVPFLYPNDIALEVSDVLGKEYVNGGVTYVVNPHVNFRLSINRLNIPDIDMVRVYVNYTLSNDIKYKDFVDKMGDEKNFEAIMDTTQVEYTVNSSLFLTQQQNNIATYVIAVHRIGSLYFTKVGGIEAQLNGGLPLNKISVNCFQNSDCNGGQYCDKSGSSPYDWSCKTDSSLDEHIAIINSMQMTIDQQATYIHELQLTIQQQATLIDGLNLDIQQKAQLINSLTARVDEQAVIINNLNLDNQDKARIILSLTNDNVKQTQLINQLQLSLNDKSEIIKQMGLMSRGCPSGQVLCQLDDNKKICSLNELDCSNGIDATKKNYGLGGIVIYSDATIINNLNLDISQKAQLINSLTTQLSEKARIINNLNLDISQKAQLISSLTSQLGEQADLMNSLEMNVQQKALIIKELTDDKKQQQDMINSLTLTLQEKDTMIAFLSQSNEEMVVTINNLTLTLQEKNELIDYLQGRKDYTWTYVLIGIAIVLGGIYIFKKKK